MGRAAAGHQLLILIKAGRRRTGIGTSDSLSGWIEERLQSTSRFPSVRLSSPLPFSRLSFGSLLLSSASSLSLLLLSYLRRQKYSRRAPPCAAIMLSTGVRLLGTVMRIFWSDVGLFSRTTSPHSKLFSICEKVWNDTAYLYEVTICCELYFAY